MVSIRRIGIIGSGKMGTDIFSFLSGYDFELVWLCIDQNEAGLQHELFTKKLNRQYRCGLIDEEHFIRLQRSVVISSTAGDLSSCDMIIECITEELSDKQELFKGLVPALQKKCILTTNSSSIIPSLLVPDAALNERIIGLHFFYPLKFKNIVEIIKTDVTSEAVLNEVTNFCDHIGKKFLLLNEKNAFILNKLFLEVQNEAFKICSEGILTYRETDEIIETYLFPEGVFRFFDQVGNDVILRSVKNYVQENTAPYKSLLDKLEELCSENRLGIKTKAGFYNYDQEAPEDNSSKERIPGNIRDSVLNQLQRVFIQKAQQIVSEGICEQELFEYAAKEYMNTDKGPFAIARELLNK